MKLKDIKLLALPENAQLHLYLAWGCPFCHRVLAALSVTGLIENISVTWTKNIKGSEGWDLDPEEEPLFEADSIKKVYQLTASEGQQRYSVPLLVDKQSKTIISTDSAEIVRCISYGLNSRYRVKLNLAPAELTAKINRHNKWLHEKVNRAVYMVGVADELTEYKTRRMALFEALDKLEDHFSTNQFLVAEQLTESDLFLLATLERFDMVYYWLFKCNLKFLSDYSSLTAYHQRVRSYGQLADTYNQKLTVEHYYLSTMHVKGKVKDLNPSKSIPAELARLID